MPDVSGHPSPLAADSPGSILLGLLRGQPGIAERLTAAEWRAALDLSTLHGVGPLLHRRLHGDALLARVPGEVRDRIEGERRDTAIFLLRSCAEMQRIAAAFAAAGIPAIPLKGLHLAECVYRDVSLRPMGDLDILVPPELVAHAADALRRLGYGADADLGASAQRLLQDKCNIGFVHRASDQLVELHWAIDEPPARNAAAVREIWRAAVRERIGDADMLAMPREFLLLHVCVHLACIRGFGSSLRALCDVAELAQPREAPDWEAVVDGAIRHDWVRPAAACLRLARDHLGAAVPDHVLSRLGADHLDRTLLDEALTQIVGYADVPWTLRMAPNLIAAAACHSRWQALRMVARRIFISRAELALAYGLSPDARSLPLFYFTRVKDLTRRYAADAWAMRAPNRHVVEALARGARLAAWAQEA